jgi:hypothetical protein
MRIHSPVLAAALLVCLSATAVHGRQLAVAPAPATAIIGGTLTSADLGRPVRKAQVKLTSASPRTTRTTATDAKARGPS